MLDFDQLPAPGNFYLKGSVLMFTGYGDPRILDAEIASIQEAADIVSDLDPDAWLYISLPRKRQKRKLKTIS